MYDAYIVYTHCIKGSLKVTEIERIRVEPKILLPAFTRV